MSASSLRSPAVILAACSVILCIGIGLRATLGLFLQPMSLENGWSRETFSLAIALQNLVWGLLGPFAGGVADRYGSGRVIAGCGLAYVIGLVAMAFASSPLGLNVGSGFLLGLALSGTTFACVLAVVVRMTPPGKRSTALGVATAAGSFGQFALLPVAQFLIGKFDWHQALLGLACIAALIIPLAAFTRGKGAAQEGPPQSIGEALREAFHEKAFHLIFWGFFVCGFQVTMFMVHLPSIVTDAGLSPTHGMTALALVGLFNIVGSFGAGWLGGRWSKKYILSINYATRAVLIATLVWIPLTPASLYIFAAGIGLLWLGTVPLTNGLVAQIFGTRYAAMLGGVVFVGHQVGSFIGVWLAGWLYDHTGSYQLALIISIGLGVFAALVNLPVDETPLSERKAVPAAA